MSSIVSLLTGVFLFSFSGLAIFKAPVSELWLPALIATEGGTYMSLVCLACAIFIPSVSGIQKFSRLLTILALILFLTPLARALMIAQTLPENFATSFGAVQALSRPGAPARSEPLSLLDLFIGIRSPKVVQKIVTFSQPGVPALQMTLYTPTPNAKDLSAVLVVHGGSWRGGTRDEVTAMNTYLAARGYLVATIDYQLAPAATFPVPRENVFTAIRFLHERAAQFGWDQKNMVLLGRSAGGQIALSAAYANQFPEIRGVIAFYTPNDLIFGYENPGNPRILNSKQLIGTYLGGALSETTRQRYHDASPLNFVGAATPPTLMIHGGRDELVWPIHDERLSRKLQAAHRPFFYLRLPWATHACDVLLNSPSGQLSTYTVERFLAAVMPASKL